MQCGSLVVHTETVQCGSLGVHTETVQCGSLGVHTETVQCGSLGVRCLVIGEDEETGRRRHVQLCDSRTEKLAV